MDDQGFKPGDRVAMVNDYGAVFPGKTIVAAYESDVRGQCYFITPTDAPWFPVASHNLVPEA